MPRLDTGQMAALATWWRLVEPEAFAGTLASDVQVLAAATAAKAGVTLGFAENTAIGQLYGYARRMSNAADAVQGAGANEVIGPEHIAVPPWARDDQVMVTTPLWHVTYAFTGTDAAGQPVSGFRTVVFEMTMPQTIGELQDAVTAAAEAAAEDYDEIPESAVLHQILAV